MLNYANDLKLVHKWYPFLSKSMKWYSCATLQSGVADDRYDIGKLYFANMCLSGASGGSWIPLQPPWSKVVSQYLSIAGTLVPRLYMSSSVVHNFISVSPATDDSKIWGAVFIANGFNNIHALHLLINIVLPSQTKINGKWFYIHAIYTWLAYSLAPVCFLLKGSR